MISISEIKKAIFALSKRGKDKNIFQQFLNSFFSYIALDDQNKKNVHELHAIAELSYKFFKHKRDKREIHVLLENNAVLKKGELVMVFLNENMPFLVDSITEYFNRQKFRIQRIVNATFAVERSKNGDLLKVFSETQVKNESFIFVKISNVTQCTNVEQLKSDCASILENVYEAVHDWHQISSVMQLVIDDFQDFNRQELIESRHFLEWLLQDNFVFVGSEQYILNKGVYKKTKDSYGICKIGDQFLKKSITEDILESNVFHTSANEVVIGKIREISKVHRSQNLEYICISKPLSNGQVQLFLFLGLFVSRLNYQSVSSIPVVREKVNFVVRKSGFVHNSFNAKELLSILESLPKRDLLQMSGEEVYNVAMTVLSCITHPRMIVMTRKNKCKKFIDVDILFPRSRIISGILEKIHYIVVKHIPGEVTDSNLNFIGVSLAYVTLSVSVKDIIDEDIDETKLEKELDRATSEWSDNLGVAIEEGFGSRHSGELIDKYAKAFDSNYSLKFSLDDAVKDIAIIEGMLKKKEKILFKLHTKGCISKASCCFKIYGVDHKVALHQIMPLFDNLGFSTIEEDLFVVDLHAEGKKVWVQYFVLQVDDHDLQHLSKNSKNIEDAVYAIFNGDAKNDITNQLILKAGFTWRQVFLINAYCKYLLQVKFVYSQDFIKATLIKHPTLAKLIIKLFDAYFSIESHRHKVKSLDTDIKNGLSKITSVSEDKVIRKFVEVVHATLRTNYFQKKNGVYKDYVSLKISSFQLTEIPLPRPFVEVFVYSLDMEGVHLRGGAISRGGIRWSDRVEDYRTEVLGLMKAQMTKNTIIVPDGSKGGFIIKNDSKFCGREALIEQSIRCYQTFLRGMLDITDNMVSGKVHKPENVVCRDSDDPYLVVAADKGTATFSDIANELAKDEYGFWLGDGFASGGAVGYDHKEMGITARGAWVSVKHHFNHYNMDPHKDEFTVVGIGDMSGDVFGNGMLLSNKIKLVAAFNHMHIFIDPNPDPKSSYKERKRLFNLPRSTWEDYNSKFISRGGGVFNRNSKTVKISKEIKKLLGISCDTIEPNDLIKAVLKSDVDLIWNGGIGTYVKSCNEENINIGNKSNDEVRVDAVDLRCRVIAEGGNLGITQLGRVEFAFNGGAVNTDFIDNSGGVDCSDHEVNIKIVLDQAITRKKINNKERDDMLLKMKDIVADLVLNDNKIQNQNISIDTADSVNDIYAYIKLIGFLTETADLNPKVEFLPNKAELSRRKQNNLGISCPEVSVLMAYSKRAVYNNIITSALPDDVFYQKYLFDYFPVQMREVFVEEIKNHPLKREIIATCATNDLINYIGINFYHIACEFTGLSGCDIIRAFSAAWDIFDLDKLWKKISLVKDFSIRVELYAKLRLFLQRVIFWLLRNHSHPIDVTSIIKVYKKNVLDVKGSLSGYLSQDLKNEYNDRMHWCKLHKLSDDLSVEISSLENLYNVLDVIQISLQNKYKFNDVLTLYFEVGEKFYYNWLHGCIDKLTIHGYWEKMLIKSLKDDVDLQHRNLSIDIIKNKKGNVESVISAWKEKNIKKFTVFSKFINSIMSLEELDYSKVIIAIKQSDILLS